MTKAAEFLQEIDEMKPERLSALARWIDDVDFYHNFMDENGYSADEMREIIIYLVKRMMHHNLVIPSDGTEVNLMSVAQDLHDDPEFGGKYDELAEEVDEA